MPTSDLEKYDNLTPGQFVRGVSAFLLPWVDGKLDASRATASRMHALLTELIKQAAAAKMVADRIPDWQLGRGALQADADALLARLETMNDFVTAKFIALGNFDAYQGDIFYCVTAPLLLGWEGNADCTGVDPKQKTEKPPLAGEPLTLIRQAQKMGAWAENEWARQAAYFAFKQVEDAVEELGDAAVVVYKAVGDELDKAVKSSIGKHVMVGAAIGVTALALYFTRKR